MKAKQARIILRRRYTSTQATQYR